MFSKDDEVINDEDVGNLVKQLHESGSEELDLYILGEDDGLDNNSQTTSSGTQDTD